MKEIIDAIKKRMTDDKEANQKILLEELEKNKNNKEVHSAIFKMIFENLPENLQDNLVRNINQDKFEERLKEIQELIVHKKYERALEYLDMSIEKINPVYEDDEFVYKTFHSPFEAYLYAKMREDSSKKIKNSELDYGVFHKFRGIILNELGRYEEAEAEFVESFKWNPLDFEAIFTYAETLYKLKKYDEFLKWNIDTLKKSYTNYQIAKCLHNIGLYYMALGDKESDITGYNIISYSLAFDETEYAYRDLNTICEKYNMPKRIAKEKDVLKTLKKEKLPEVPDGDLLRKLVEMARSFMNVNDEFAVYIFKIIYNITHDEVTKEYIKAGENAIQQKRSKK